MTVSIKPESISSQAELVANLIEEATVALREKARAEAQLDTVVQLLRGPEAGIALPSASSERSAGGVQGQR